VQPRQLQGIKSKRKSCVLIAWLLVIIPPFTASLPRAVSVDPFKQRIARAIERRFQSTEHNERRMTADK
jgi:hypothetical protein